LSQCALAGVKPQKNLAERRFCALRRENRALAGWDVGESFWSEVRQRPFL